MRTKKRMYGALFGIIILPFAVLSSSIADRPKDIHLVINITEGRLNGDVVFLTVRNVTVVIMLLSV